MRRRGDAAPFGGEHSAVPVSRCAAPQGLLKPREVDLSVSEAARRCYRASEAFSAVASAASPLISDFQA
ncbi:MAG TPA: hypothetical protein VGJ74_12140, partial [Burkholderiales bacterium]